jgi:hypothetical protein
METVIITICGLFAVGWAIGKTGQAVHYLRAQRFAGNRQNGAYDSGSPTSLGPFGGGSTSGDSGGHGHGGHGHGGHGGDCGAHGG